MYWRCLHCGEVYHSDELDGAYCPCGSLDLEPAKWQQEQELEAYEADMASDYA